MVKTARIACLACALLSAGSHPVRAQEPSALRVEALSELFADLPPSTGVQLVTLGGSIEEGSLVRVGDRGIEVAADGQAYEVGYDFIRGVRVEGGHGLQGAVWGGAGGALAGVFFGALYGAFDCQTALECTDQERTGAWTWGAILGGVGAGVGFVFGRRDVHWHPIFP